jgi:hypothetical protein
MILGILLQLVVQPEYVGASKFGEPNQILTHVHNTVHFA